MAVDEKIHKAKLDKICSEIQKTFGINPDVIIEPGERKIVEQCLHDINKRDGTRLAITIEIKHGKTHMLLLDPTAFISVKLCRYCNITRTAVR